MPLKFLNIDVRPHTVQKTAKNAIFGLNINKNRFLGVLGALRGPIYKLKESKDQPCHVGPKVREKKKFAYLGRKPHQKSSATGCRFLIITKASKLQLKIIRWISYIFSSKFHCVAAGGGKWVIFSILDF